MFGREEKRAALLFAYALAVSEENAAALDRHRPTCGSAGVLPAVLYQLKKERRLSDRDILQAGRGRMIGNLAKTNASISGAEVGCQGEIGVACAMASGAAAKLLGGTVARSKRAERGIEHHLGLTCDPVLGLVQIPASRGTSSPLPGR
jgi:L-serine dehydratase